MISVSFPDSGPPSPLFETHLDAAILTHGVVVKTWAASVAVALIVIGVLPRIHKRKLGLDRLQARFRDEEPRSA